MFIIPNQESKKHLQDNKSDLTGTIYQSRNISLDEQGYIKLADSSFAQYTEDDDEDFDKVDAMGASNTAIYLNTDVEFSGVARLDTPLSQEADASAPDPGVEEDVLYFNGTMVVSDGTKISYLSSAPVWTDITGFTGSSTSYPGVLTTFGSSLAFGNGRFVYFVNTSWVVNTTILTLPNEYQVSSMVSIGNNLYIATRSNYGGDAKLFVIDSIKTSADYAYPVGTFEIASIKPFKSTFVGVNSLGELLRFNGGGFEVIGTLPIYATNIEWADAQNDYSRIANRAVITDGDLVYINLSSLTQDGRFKMLPNFPSGIWCYDDSNGALYHKYSPSFSKRQTLNYNNFTFNAATDTFTLTSGNLNEVITGMPMFFEGSASDITGLKSGGVAYYIIKLSSTQFKVANTYANALAGTAIDIAGTSLLGVEFYVIKINDYGFSLYGNRMSTLVLNSQICDSRYLGRVCMTAELGSKQTISTPRTVFSVISPYLPNRGYFITPRLNSANVTDQHNLLSLKFKPLGVEDKIILKYKTKDRKNYPKSSVEYSSVTGVWTSTTVFTTTADLSDTVAGDEIEIIAGVGSGHIAHISTISEASGTYTVTLSDAFPFAVANDQMYFIVDNWTYLDTITSANTEHYYTAQIGASGKFMQVKVEMRGIGVTIEELQIDNNYLLPSRN